jgi:predicted cupin superfamily sugar epimerase
MTEARAWIERLGLRRHPEGGYFRETYRAEERVAGQHLPGRFGGERAFSTAIYFLLEGEDFSALHALKQDEVWHFYAGSSLTIHVIDPDGSHAVLRLGRNPAEGEEPQALVRAGRLMGAVVNEPESYALVGCTAAPGFEFADFSLPSRAELCARFPQHGELIRRLTRRR